ncbi:MAG TPA: PA0069 family radical SAM protein [Burkholderiaceae bacterium]|nr:PA0069 family radical SAM protein [Burkholderiaceae bacterium]
MRSTTSSSTSAVSPQPATPPLKGRGTTSRIQGRFETWAREPNPQPSPDDEPAPKPITIVASHHAKSAISRNDSPDIPFEQSINPYMGCEHGCVYCYARPSHAYLGLSPGLDFETRLYAKPNLPEVLRRELAAPGYTCKPITIGGNTDPYQPIEREQRITRQVIEVLAEHRHPFSIITKNALIERDIDLMAPMAQHRLVRAYISITNWDTELARKLEPRAAAPWRRMQAIERLSSAGIPVGVLVAPIIPFVTDCYIEEILERAAQAGATSAGYVLLRLPHEVGPLFKDWLDQHFPLKTKHVMSLMEQLGGGKQYDARWRVRQTGSGPFADLIAQRFRLACRRFGLATDHPPHDVSRFEIPGRSVQLSLL